MFGFTVGVSPFPRTDSDDYEGLTTKKHPTKLVALGLQISEQIPWLGTATRKKPGNHTEKIWKFPWNSETGNHQIPSGNLT